MKKLMEKVRGVRRIIFAAMIIGIMMGAGAVVVTQEINKATSVDTFCVSCHTMKVVADDPYYIRSSHRANTEGVQATCGDCHIPSTNFFVETYVHVAQAAKDTYIQLTRDFSEPGQWEALRVDLARQVRQEMRENDGVTCRGCHDAAAIMPETEAGRVAHELVTEGLATCIDCHMNLVHMPVQPGQ